MNQTVGKAQQTLRGSDKATSTQTSIYTHVLATGERVTRSFTNDCSSKSSFNQRQVHHKAKQYTVLP